MRRQSSGGLTKARGILFQDNLLMWLASWRRLLAGEHSSSQTSAQDCRSVLQVYPPPPAPPEQMIKSSKQVPQCLIGFSFSSLMPSFP